MFLVYHIKSHITHDLTLKVNLRDDGWESKDMPDQNRLNPKHGKIYSCTIKQS